MKKNLENILRDNWLSIYDEIPPKDYENIEEKEEIVCIVKEVDGHE